MIIRIDEYYFPRERCVFKLVDTTSETCTLTVYCNNHTWDFSFIIGSESHQNFLAALQVN